MFESIIQSATDVQGSEYVICTACSLIFGFIIALVHMYKNEYSKNMIISLVLLPAIVQSVIMLVNGNIGTGIAVMGAFSLIRFRSTPGNAREICSVFFSMTVGLAMAMGQIGIAAVLVVMVGLVTVMLVTLSFGDKLKGQKNLKIVIPENLDYENIFDEIFEEYTAKHELIRVRTVNMGSLYELQYNVVMKKSAGEKAFIDALRCRNGNLGITLGRALLTKEDL